MQQRKYLKNLSLLLLFSLTISGCSLIPKQVEVQTKFIERKIPIQEPPKGLTLYPVTFYAVTEDNYKEFEEKFKDKNNDIYLGIEHEAYGHLTIIDDETRESLAKEFS